MRRWLLGLLLLAAPAFVRATEAPSSLMVTQLSPTAQRLVWTDSDDGVTDTVDGYFVERCTGSPAACPQTLPVTNTIPPNSTPGVWAVITTTAINVKTCDDSGLTTGTQYTYRVRRAPYSVLAPGTPSTSTTSTTTTTTTTTTSTTTTSTTTTTTTTSTTATTLAGSTTSSTTTTSTTTTTTTTTTTSTTTTTTTTTTTSSTTTTTIAGGSGTVTRFIDIGNPATSGSFTYANGVDVDNATGDFYVTGRYDGTVNFGGGNVTGANDFYIARYTSGGAFGFLQHYGGSGSELPFSLKRDVTGGLTVGGYFVGSATFGGATVASTAGVDAWIARYTSLGAFLWQKIINSTIAPGDDVVTSVDADSGGNPIFGGYYKNRVVIDSTTISTSSGGAGAMLGKLSSASGTVVWARGIVCTADARVRGVVVDASDNVYVVGEYTGGINFTGTYLNTHSAAYSDMFVGKFNSAGTAVWGVNLGGSNADNGWGIAIGGDGQPVIIGTYSGTVDTGAGILTSTSGSVDYLVAKLNANTGAVTWARSVGGIFQEGSGINGQAIASDSGGNVSITGNFNGSMDTGVGTLVAAGTASNTTPDVFAMRFSAGGSPVWARRFGGTSEDEGNAMRVQSDGQPVVVGQFRGAATGFATVTSSGILDGFLTRFVP